MSRFNSNATLAPSPNRGLGLIQESGFTTEGVNASQPSGQSRRNAAGNCEQVVLDRIKSYALGLNLG
jgi:hypothetical protein